MYLLAFIKAVGDVLSAINGIYTFVKNVNEFTSQEPTDDVRARYMTAYAATIATRNATISACWNILSAIRTLDERIFRSLMADKLGDADQAMQDLEYWRRSGSDTARDLALDRSAGALADMLNLVSGGAYPALAVVFGHVQILGVRLAVLSEADPAFAKSPLTRQPITAGIALIRSAVTDLERAVLDANQIDTVERVTLGKRPKEGPRPEFHWVRVLYRNATGTVSYDTEVGPTEGEEAPNIDAALQAALAVQARGIADDRAAARISDLTDAADRLETIVHDAELRIVTGLTGLVATPILRARYQLLRNDHDPASSLDAILADTDTITESTLDFKAAARALGRGASKTDERLLRDVLQNFGRRAFLHLLIDASPVDTGPDGSGPAQQEVKSDGHTTNTDPGAGRTRRAAVSTGRSTTGPQTAAGQTAGGTGSR